MATKAERRKAELEYSCTYIPTLKISPAFIVAYSTKVETKQRNKNVYWNFGTDDTKKKTYSGEMTEGSQKRLKEKCELLNAITTPKSYVNSRTGKRTSFKLIFVTLTLSAPQGKVTDKELKQFVLKPFIRTMKTKGMRNYIWKAERQKNGNLHFHLFMDSFIYHTVIRKVWNQYQEKFNFISQFEAKWGHRNPNSTDVEAIRDEKGVTNYMIKYMMKSPKEDKEEEEIGASEVDIFGRCWDCSERLKIKNNTAEFATDEEFDLINQAVESGHLVKHSMDFCTLFFYRGKRKEQYLPPTLMNRYKSYISKVRNFIPHSEALNTTIPHRPSPPPPPKAPIESAYICPF